MAVGAADETPESWARLLAGLSEICAGIGVARQNELCECVCGDSPRGCCLVCAWGLCECVCVPCPRCCCLVFALGLCVQVCVCKQDLDHTGFYTRLLATATADRAVCVPCAPPPSPKKTAKTGGDADLAGLFPSDAFQQLLAACPTPACEACVWAITQVGGQRQQQEQMRLVLCSLLQRFWMLWGALQPASTALQKRQSRQCLPTLTNPWWLGGVCLFTRLSVCSSS